MRVRGASTGIDALSEGNEDAALSTSKLRGELIALAGVDILKEGGNAFKSTFQIAEELSGVWNSGKMKDLDKANVIELIAGKRSGNIVASLFENFDVAKEAAAVSRGAAGSTEREFAKWSDSIEAHTARLGASWQQFSMTFMNSDFLKVGITGLTGLLQVITQLGAALSSVGSLAGVGALAGLFQMLRSGSQITGIGSLFKEIGSAFSNFGKGAGGFLSSVNDAFNAKGLLGGLGSIGSLIGNGLKGFLSTGLGMATGAGIGVAIVSSIVGGIKAQKTNYEAALQETIGTNMNMVDSMEAIDDLYAVHYKDTKLSANEQNNFTSAVNQTNDALIKKSLELRKAGATDQQYMRQMAFAAQDEQLKLINDTHDKQKALLASQDYSAFGKKINPIIADPWSQNISDIERQALDEQAKWMRGRAKIEEVGTGSNLHTEYKKLSDDIGSNIEWYLGHQKAMEELEKKQLTNSDAYKSSKAEVERMKPVIDQVLANESDMLQKNYLKNKKMVDADLDTLGEYKEMEDFIVKSLKLQRRSGEFIEEVVGRVRESNAGKEGMDFSKLGSVFGKKEEPKKVTDELYSEMAKELKDNPVQKWFESLKGEDREIAYKIAINSDAKDMYDLKRFTELVDYAKRNGGKTYDESMFELGQIMMPGVKEGLSERFKTYMSSVQTASDMYRAIDNGESTFADRMAYALDNTDLIPFINNLEKYKQQLNEINYANTQAEKNQIVESLKQLREVSPEGSEAAEAGLMSLYYNFDRLQRMSLQFDMASELNNLGAINTALGQSTGTGVAIETFDKINGMFREMEGYDPTTMFEKTSLGLRMNTSELLKYQDAFAGQKAQKINKDMLDTQKALIDREKEYGKLKAEYDSKKGAGEFDKTERSRVIRDDINDINQEILRLDMLRNAYQGVTSEYAKWQTMQSAPDVNADYSNVQKGLENAKKLYEAGEYGSNKLKSQLQLMTGRDMSDANARQVRDAWEATNKVIGNTGITIQDMFAEGASGATNFGFVLDGLNENVISLDTNTNRWSATMSETQANNLAKEMGITLETLELLGQNLEQFGGQFKIEADTSALGIALNEIDKARAKLLELGGTPVEVNLNFQSLAEGATEIENVKQRIAELKEYRDTLDSDDPARVRVDAEVELAEAQLRALEEKVRAMENKEATVKVKAVIDKIENNLNKLKLPDVVKIPAELVIGKFKEFIEGNKTPTVPTQKQVVDIEVKGQDKVSQVKQDMAAIYDRGVKLTVEVTNSEKVDQVKKDLLAIYDRGVKLDVIVSNDDKIKQVKENLLAIYDRGVRLDVIVANDDKISRVKEDMLAIYDRGVKLDVIVSNDEKISQVKEDLLAIYDRTVKLDVISEGTDSVTTVQEALLAIYDRTVLLTVVSEGVSAVSEVQQSLLEMYDRDVYARAHAEGLEELSALQTAINAVQGRTVTTSTTTSGYIELAMLQAAINMIYGRTVTVAAVGDTSGLAGVQSAINSISGRTVYVDVVYRQIGSARSEGTVGRAFVSGTAYANGSGTIGGRKLSSLGKAKQDSMALLGELGEELIVEFQLPYTVMYIE